MGSTILSDEYFVKNFFENRGISRDNRHCMSFYKRQNPCSPPSVWHGPGVVVFVLSEDGLGMYLKDGLGMYLNHGLSILLYVFKSWIEYVFEGWIEYVFEGWIQHIF